MSTTPGRKIVHPVLSFLDRCWSFTLYVAGMSSMLYLMIVGL